LSGVFIPKPHHRRRNYFRSQASGKGKYYGSHLLMLQISVDFIGQATFTALFIGGTPDEAEDHL
jgi:hypothetical protein